MPIIRKHSPPYNLVGAGAYRTGQREGYAERRSELERLGLAYNQMAQQQQQHQDRLAMQWYQPFQRGQIENTLSQQDFARRMALGQMAGMQDQAIQQMRGDNLVEQIRARQEAEVQELADQQRAELEQSLGSVRPDEGLRPEGQAVYRSIANELSQLDEQLSNGVLRPRDYYHAISNLRGRAAQLELPRLQAERPRTVQQMVEEDGMGFVQQHPEDPFTSILWSRKADGTVEGRPITHDRPSSNEQREAYPDGQSIGQIWRDSAGIVTRNKDGEVEVLVNAADELKAAEESMLTDTTWQATAMAPTPSFDIGGMVTDMAQQAAMQHHAYENELRRRFNMRMNILGEQYGLTAAPTGAPGGAPPAAPAGGGPPQHPPMSMGPASEAPAQTGLPEYDEFIVQAGSGAFLSQPATMLAGTLEHMAQQREAQGIPFDQIDFPDFPPPQDPIQAVVYTRQARELAQQYMDQEAPEEVQAYIMRLIEALREAQLIAP